MSSNIGADVVVCIDDKFERIRCFLDGDVGVGVKRELQDFGEDMRESPELLLPANNVGGVGLRGEIVSHGDVSPIGCWVNFHGSSIGGKTKP